MVVKRLEKVVPQTGEKELSMRLSSKLNRVKEAITHLPEGETEMTTATSTESPRKGKRNPGNGKKAAVKAEGTTLADICKGLKMEPRTARRVLRNAEFQVDGGRWTFTKASDVAKVEKLLKASKED